MNIQGIATLFTMGGVGTTGFGVWAHMRAKRLLGTPLVGTGDAARGVGAGPKGEISCEGTVRCDQPLVSPVTGTPCLFYKLVVTGTWKDGDKTKSEEYVAEYKAADFVIDDGSGPVRVVPTKSSSMPIDRTFGEEKKEGFFDDLKNALGKGKAIQFGRYAFQNPPMSRADKFYCEEWIVPLQTTLYACGKSDGGAIVEPKWSSLILSPHGRDTLAGKTQKHAKIGFIAGPSALGLSALLFVVGAFVGPQKPGATAMPAAAITPGSSEDEARAAQLQTERRPSPRVEVTQISSKGTRAPLSYDGSAVTAYKAALIAPGCSGYLMATPVRVFGAPSSGVRLRVHLESPEKAMLLVRGADESLTCSDGNDVVLESAKGATSVYVRSEHPRGELAYTLSAEAWPLTRKGRSSRHH